MERWYLQTVLIICAGSTSVQFGMHGIVIYTQFFLSGNSSTLWKIYMHSYYMGALRERDNVTHHNAKASPADRRWNVM